MFVASLSADYNFSEAYDMQMATGRWFDEDFVTDKAAAFVVNETAVREFKWETPEKAIGKTINREGKQGKVIGVMKDFNFASLTTPISSMVVDLNPNQFNALSIRFENSEVQSTISNIESKWNTIFPEKAFQFTFLDEQIESQYDTYATFGTVIRTFTVIAILISCLGVYGLVLFVVQRKVKEIGVRKVLGASIRSILQLIYKEFAVLIIVGFILAIPLSFYLMNQWLENFTYRTSIDVQTYVITLSIILVITFLTISNHAIRASLVNPVKSLRSE